MNTAKNQRHLAKGLAFAAAGLCLAAAAGCHHGPITHGEDFTPAGTPTSIGQFAQTQAANGARSDATLGTQHFEGADLNALGEVKLDLMLRAAPANAPVVVYMNLPQSASKQSLAACKTSVTNYLVDSGVPQAQIQLVEGPNVTGLTPTARTMPTVYKADASGFNGVSADALGPADLNAVGANSIGSSGAGGGH